MPCLALPFSSLFRPSCGIKCEKSPNTSQVAGKLHHIINLLSSVLIVSWRIRHVSPGNWAAMTLSPCKSTVVRPTRSPSLPRQAGLGKHRFAHTASLRDAFKKKKKVNFGTSAQKGGRGQSQIPNVDQYWIWDIYVRGEGVLRSMSQYCIWFFSYIECSTCPMSTVFIGASL